MTETPSARPPKPFKITPSGALRIVQGGGCLSLFGAPFLLAGIFMALAATGVVPMEDASGTAVWERAVMLLFGMVFAGVGAVLVFGRTWITVDPSRGVVGRIHGVIVPIRRREEDLAAFGRLAVDFIAGDSDTADRYEVALKRKAGGEGMALYTSTRYDEAQERAMFLAGFLKMDLEDNSTDHQSVLKPDDLAHPLRGRLARHAEVIRDACPPLGMKSVVTDDGMTLRIELPPPGFSYGSIVSLAIPVAVAWYFLEAFVPFFDRTQTPQFVADVFTGFVLLFLFAIPVYAFTKSVIRSFRKTAVIEIDAQGCTVTKFAAFGRKTVTVPLADIVDLDYGTAAGRKAAVMASAEEKAEGAGGAASDIMRRKSGIARFAAFLARFTPARGIVVKTRKDMIVVGEGLPDDEVVYLFAVMAGRLAAAVGA